MHTAYCEYINKLKGARLRWWIRITTNLCASFDVSSLFSNVPLDDTITICGSFEKFSRNFSSLSFDYPKLFLFSLYNLFLVSLP